MSDIYVYRHWQRSVPTQEWLPKWRIWGPFEQTLMQITNKVVQLLKLYYIYVKFWDLLVLNAKMTSHIRDSAFFDEKTLNSSGPKANIMTQMRHNTCLSNDDDKARRTWTMSVCLILAADKQPAEKVFRLLTSGFWITKKSLNYRAT